MLYWYLFFLIIPYGIFSPYFLLSEEFIMFRLRDYIFNTKNPIGLNIDIKDTMAETWEFYYADGEIASDIVR